jgi:hypothetical protein
MRRGLISWSQEELPVAVLDARIGRLQQAMRAEHLDAVLAYTSFAQPAPVQWLTNFVPYWADAVLAVPPEGAPALLAALTQRVHPWIRTVAHLGELISAPKLGEKIAATLLERAPGARRIGVIGLDSLPWSVAHPLAEALGTAELVDVTALYADLRQPADAAERALTRRSEAIGRAALAAIPATASKASEVLAAAEASARLAGVEEILQRIAPDLGGNVTLRRMEGDAPLGARYAIEASLAYKGAWIRLARAVARDGAEPASWRVAQAWFEAACARLDGKNPAAALAEAPGHVEAWTLEASVGVAPLSIVAASGMPVQCALPEGSLAVLSVRLQLEDGPWLASTPVTIGRPR